MEPMDRFLKPLEVGCPVPIQDSSSKRWDKRGVIVEISPNRDYRIKLPSGRVYWRNRQFVRKDFTVDPIPPPAIRSENTTRKRIPGPVRFAETPQASPRKNKETMQSLYLTVLIQMFTHVTVIHGYDLIELGVGGGCQDGERCYGNRLVC